MAKRAKSKKNSDIAAIEGLMSDLEQRLQRLTGAAKREVSGGTGDVQGFVSDAINGIMGRVRTGANTMTDSLTDEATRMGTDVFKKLSREVEQRPMVLLAVAVGVGFLFGLTRR